VMPAGADGLDHRFRGSRETDELPAAAISESTANFAADRSRNRGLGQPGARRVDPCIPISESALTAGHNVGEPTGVGGEADLPSRAPRIVGRLRQTHSYYST
jgi:hypothetical protein